MKHVASTALTVLSTLMLGFYALVWLLTPQTKTLASHDSRTLFIHAIGVVGLAFAAMAFRELRKQRNEAMRLKQENEGFV